MKSAYGRQTPAPDYELTCVEPGSPMGELLRRYWQPACTSDELADLPRKVKLLCEELVLFRDKKGRVGALELHCAHRGASLEWGRVEADGLRCCYHGWLYDAEGRCLDMPCETDEFRRRMDVWQPAYQIRRVQDGLDPLNVVRDAALNHKIPTRSWNTILSPAEAATHRGQEV